MNKDVVQLTSELISRRSITPEDDGCQELLCAHLKKCQFEIEHFPF